MKLSRLKQWKNLTVKGAALIHILKWLCPPLHD